MEEKWTSFDFSARLESGQIIVQIKEGDNVVANCGLPLDSDPKEHYILDFIVKSGIFKRSSKSYFIDGIENLKTETKVFSFQTPQDSYVCKFDKTKENDFQIISIQLAPVKGLPKEKKEPYVDGKSILKTDSQYQTEEEMNRGGVFKLD